MNLIVVLSWWLKHTKVIISDDFHLKQSFEHSITT